MNQVETHQSVDTYLENKLLLVFINFTPQKPARVATNKRGTLWFSRYPDPDPQIQPRVAANAYFLDVVLLSMLFGERAQTWLRVLL